MKSHTEKLSLGERLAIYRLIRRTQRETIEGVETFMRYKRGFGSLLHSLRGTEGDERFVSLRRAIEAAAEDCSYHLLCLQRMEH